MSIAEKVAHVKRAGQSRAHECHWPGCDKQVSPAMWGCKAHWFSLPRGLRDRVWRTYVPGQEVRGNPSAEYIAAAKAVQDWIVAYQTSQRGQGHKPMHPSHADSRPTIGAAEV